MPVDTMVTIVYPIVAVFVGVGGARYFYRANVMDGSFRTVRAESEGEDSLSAEEREIIRLDTCARHAAWAGFWLGLAWPLAIIGVTAYGIILGFMTLPTLLSRKDVKAQLQSIRDHETDALTEQYIKEPELLFQELDEIEKEHGKEPDSYPAPGKGAHRASTEE